jgi:hypothetical protein
MTCFLQPVLMGVLCLQQRTRGRLWHEFICVVVWAGLLGREVVCVQHTSLRWGSSRVGSTGRGGALACMATACTRPLPSRSCILTLVSERGLLVFNPVGVN